MPRRALARVVRALACALFLGGIALACPPAPEPFVPFDGEPFRFRADLVDVAACSVGWFTVDETGVSRLDVETVINTAITEWLLLDHATSFPLFLEPDQVVGPMLFDEIFGNRVTLDGRSFVVAFGFRFDRVYNEAIFMRLAFELPPRPSAVPPPPPARPEPTLVEVQRERWGAFEVVGESDSDQVVGRLDRVRIVDEDNTTLWTLGPGTFEFVEFAIRDLLGEEPVVLTVTGHYGGNCCAPEQHHFLQDDGLLMPIAGSKAARLVDLDGDGIAERRDFVVLRLHDAGRAFDLPVVQRWQASTQDFGPVITRDTFPGELESLLEWDRGRLDRELRFGDRVIQRAVQVYAVAYYMDPSAAAVERENLRGVLPEPAAAELELLFPEIEAAVDAFVAEADTWQPEGLDLD